MFAFDHATKDPRSLKDTRFEGVDLIVKSLNAFCNRAAILLYLLGVHVSVENVSVAYGAIRRLSEDATFMLKRTLLQSLLLELRAMHERDSVTLGGKSIAAGLCDEKVRSGLIDYIDKNRKERGTDDPLLRARCLDYVQKYCAILTCSDAKCGLDGHPLAAKMFLVRRMANKAYMHMSADEFNLSKRDLFDVSMATIVVACAIDMACGDAVLDRDLLDIESRSYESAGLLLGMRYKGEANHVPFIRAFLPKWVASDIEFPRMPRSNEEHTALLDSLNRAYVQ